MEKINVIRSLQSFVVLPFLATNLILTPTAFSKIPTVAVSATVQNRHLFGEASDNKQTAVEEKALKIDSYFESFDSPLAGYGKKFVIEAEKNDLPWNLLPAVAMAESTGCKFIVPGTNNCFGWGSGKIKFSSINESIEVIAKNLGGNNPNTAIYYADKTLEEMLANYNPPIVAPRYLKIIKSVMKTIEEFQLPTEVIALEN